jgi:hypothetical protein
VPWVYFLFILFRRWKWEKVTSGAIISKGKPRIIVGSLLTVTLSFSKGEVLMLNATENVTFFYLICQEKEILCDQTKPTFAADDRIRGRSMVALTKLVRCSLNTWIFQRMEHMSGRGGQVG